MASEKPKPDLDKREPDEVDAKMIKSLQKNISRCRVSGISKYQEGPEMKDFVELDDVLYAARHKWEKLALLDRRIATAVWE